MTEAPGIAPPAPPAVQHIMRHEGTVQTITGAVAALLKSLEPQLLALVLLSALTLSTFAYAVHEERALRNVETMALIQGCLSRLAPPPPPVTDR